MRSVSDTLSSRAKGGIPAIFNHPVFLILTAGLFLLVLIWFALPPDARPAPDRQGERPNPFEDPAAGMAYVRKLADRNGENFDRLPEDDKILLNSIAMGHGRDLLVRTAREQKQKHVP